MQGAKLSLTLAASARSQASPVSPLLQAEQLLGFQLGFVGPRPSSFLSLGLS